MRHRVRSRNQQQVDNDADKPDGNDIGEDLGPHRNANARDDLNVADHQPYQAPYGGRDARLGTNPFSAAVPGPNGPVLMLDTATTMIAFGKARVAHEKGVPVPDGALVDVDGHAHASDRRSPGRLRPQPPW